MKKNLPTRDWVYQLVSEFGELLDELELKWLQKLLKLIDNGGNYDELIEELRLFIIGDDRYVDKAIQNVLKSVQSGTRDKIVKELLDNGINSPLLNVISQTNPILQRIISTTFQDYLTARSKMLNNVEVEVLKSIQRATIKYTSGVPLDRAIKQEMAKNASDIFKFVDSSGRKWDIKSYMEMNIRTNSANLNQEVETATLTSYGYDLVIINVLSDSCDRCEPWENRVVSLTGVTPNYPTLDEAIASGYKHPNCRHSENLYIEGVSTKPFKASAEVTKHNAQLRDEQRYIERQIRKYKKSAIFDSKYNTKVREWQGKMREFIKRTGRTRQYLREQ